MTGTLVLRADSAFFQSDVIAAVLRHKACVSITARLNPPDRKVIDTIPADGWTTIGLGVRGAGVCESSRVDDDVTAEKTSMLAVRGLLYGETPGITVRV